MGLAAPKNRSKISADPQNTTWANNTERFGHRLLKQQGWTPGTSLGATDAAHAAHYTQASQSHIRVLLKDDNLGLGAKRGSERAENFGLAGLASVLGRLNGNEEDVKKEEARTEEVERKRYVVGKFGMMNFVSAGFLVGGEIKGKDEISEEQKSGESEGEGKEEKKRKRVGDDEEKEDTSEDQPKLKRKKKSMDLREEAAKNGTTESSSKAKKSKKNKDKKSKKSRETSSPAATDSSTSTTEPLSDKARRKAERRARKEEKKVKKALKRAAREAAQSNPSTNDSSSESEDEDETTTTTSSVPTTGTSTPMSGLTFGAGGRHAVRQRYIRSKRMAAMDPQALKEIFMIKTPS
ncbi:hypothetical protein P280DRAFT_503815 [Massarina eburnea CBS 473.64]|uniref:PinX1-related protein 1 n=1 Tax=Massarina eburnea CBS 473.64 TaxID=1395130 RepID=A0A6A6SH26_9PLEO|nr:hypothetical protein P280DRAFT_503815 [Massarina eburnea CBS 473.64]